MNILIIYLLGMTICFCVVYIACEVYYPSDEIENIAIYGAVSLAFAFVWPATLTVAILHQIGKWISIKRKVKKEDERK